jgi:hypothetical protein
MSRTRRRRRNATSRRRRNPTWTQAEKAALVQAYVKQHAAITQAVEQKISSMLQEMPDLKDYLGANDPGFIKSGVNLMDTMGIPEGALGFLGMIVEVKTGYAGVIETPFLRLLFNGIGTEERITLLNEFIGAAECDRATVQQLLKEQLSPEDAADCFVGAFYEAKLFPSILMAQYEGTPASELAKNDPDALREIAAVSLSPVPIMGGEYLAIHYGAESANPALCKDGNEDRCVTKLNFGIDVCMFDCTQALWAWVVLIAKQEVQAGGYHRTKKLNPKRRRNTGKREDWAEVAAMNPYPAESDSQLAGATRPIVMVSWLETISWLNCLSMIQGLDPCYEVYEDKIVFDTEMNGYRLPSEMEWEVFACANQCYTYAGSEDPNAVAWYADNSNNQLHAVGQKAPNGFGLYDCSGNVYEMTFTPYDSKGEKCGNTSWFNGRTGVNGFKEE